MIENKTYLKKKNDYSHMYCSNFNLEEYMHAKLLVYINRHMIENNKNNKFYYYLGILAKALTTLRFLRPYYIMISDSRIKADKYSIDLYFINIAYVYKMIKYYTEEYDNYSTSTQLLRYIYENITPIDKKEIRELRRFYLKELLNQKG